MGGLTGGWIGGCSWVTLEQQINCSRWCGSVAIGTCNVQYEYSISDDTIKVNLIFSSLRSEAQTSVRIPPSPSMER